MSPETLLIKPLCNLETYRQYRDIVPKVSHDLVEGIYKALDGLLVQVARDISLEELEAFHGLHMTLEEDTERKVVSGIFNDLRTQEIGEDVINSCLRTIRERDTASKLAVECINVVEGRRDFQHLTSLWTGYQESFVSTDSGHQDHDQFVTTNLEELYESTISQQGLRWRLDCLNKSLGSLRKGDFGFLFARPETGKTTFLASEVTNFCSQTEGPILWLNNEEGGKKVVVRNYQAALGLTLQELMSDRTRNQEKFLECTKGNLRLVDSASIHRKQVEQLCETLKPALVIFDQIDKIKGFANDREDLRLGAIYIWARELAKTYCPVIGVCQADGLAGNKKWLTMENVANAKTSKQAEADWILGIGKVEEVGFEYIRYLNISKNKLSGDVDSIPELRHGKFEVVIEPNIGRYRDL